MPVKAYLGAKYYEDNRNREEIEWISKVLNKKGIESVYIARDIERWGEIKLSSKELMQRTFYEIDHSDIVILEMSEKGVGLGIEAGYAFAKGKPVFVLIKEGMELSNTMQGVARRVITYRHLEEINLLFNTQMIQRQARNDRAG